MKIHVNREQLPEVVENPIFLGFPAEFPELQGLNAAGNDVNAIENGLEF